MLAYISALFGYNHWANVTVHQALREVNRPPEQVVSCFNHILAAEWLWLNRLQGEAQSMAVWPELSRIEQGEQLTALQAAWGHHLASLTDEVLAHAVEYVNSRGESWSSRVHDILMHVVIHSAYHRGQIASALRDAGSEPAYTDFIHAVRTGAVHR